MLLPLFPKTPGQIERERARLLKGAYLDERGVIYAHTVERASEWFGVSTRRVRQMLEDGMLKGEKHGRAWRVFYPYQVVIGQRGPRVQRFRKEPELMPAKPKKTRKLARHDNPVFKKGE